MYPLLSKAFIAGLILCCSSSCISQNPEKKTQSISLPIPEKLTDENRHPLYLSHDYGQSWEVSGIDLPKHLQGSFMDSIGHELILATDNEGLFISTNNRQAWKNMGTNLPGKKVNALFVDGNTLYVGLFQKGIYSTNDMGLSWQNLNYNLPDLRVHCFLIDKGKWLAGTDSGIFIFNPSDKEWVLVSEDLQIVSLNALDGTLIAGTNSGTIRSRDNGRNWEWIHQEGAVHFSHIIGKRVVELCISGALYLSEDWGENWYEAAYSPHLGSYVYQLAEVGPFLVISNNYGIHQSRDGGRTFEQVFETEDMGFFEFFVVGETLYGATRSW